MLFVENIVKTEEISEINNFFTQFDNEFEPVKTVDADSLIDTPVSKYISSLVCTQYKKAVGDIANTNISNKRLRKRNLQQIMQESFFAGANRFGNNFIA